MTQSDLDRKAIEAATLRHDAEQGWRLMAQLSAKWYEQGFNARRMGLRRDDPGLFSQEHRQGWDAARSERTLSVRNIGGLPALHRTAVSA